MNGRQLAELTPMELMACEDQEGLTERELELLEVVHRLKRGVEHFETKYERQVEITRQLRYDLSEARSGLKLPGWARA